jgi:hypothetical protein
VSKNITTETRDEHDHDRIVELVSSGVWRHEDGLVEVCLNPKDDAWTWETGLRLTEDDALELMDAMRHAETLISGSRPQAFIRLRICEPTA